MKTITYYEDNLVARVSLNRPEVHNAFDDIVIEELLDVFQNIIPKSNARVVVITGNGKSFCAGADLNWMRRMKDYSYDENLQDALKLADMFHSIYTCPLPTIARVNGSAFGGGTGLVSVCDIAIAVDSAKFSFSEVKLGLIPSVISPYIIKKCGEGNTRELFLTGERIDAERAVKVGLINYSVSEDKLDDKVNEFINQFISSGPKALTACKQLVEKVPKMNYDEVKQYTAEIIAKLRISDEGQEGISAFFEKRKPKWCEF